MKCRLHDVEIHTHTLTTVLRQSPIVPYSERHSHCRIAVIEDEIKHALLNVESEGATAKISCTYTRHLVKQHPCALVHAFTDTQTQQKWFSLEGIHLNIGANSAVLAFGFELK
jgi:hypothetical protein